jgi:tripartite-type tricarboxylate transporter receptor subunit TctC
VPTFAEAVHRDLVQRYWHGIAAPAGTPAPVVSRLAGAIAEVVRSDYLRSRATPDMTLDPLVLDDFAQLVREEQALFGRLIRERNITVG